MEHMANNPLQPNIPNPLPCTSHLAPCNKYLTPMKKPIILFSILAMGLSLPACRNAKDKPVAAESFKKTFDSISSENLSSDSLKDYLPDDRELQQIYEGVFDIPELYVAQSPAKEMSVLLKPSESVVSFDISPAGLIVAAVISDESNNYIKLWKIDQDDFFETINIPDSITPGTISWHPHANAFFITANTDGRHSIIRYDKEGAEWSTEVIYSSKSAINRLILCPRPFLNNYNRRLNKSLYSFRLFFGLQKDDGSYRIATITEFGRKFYQVIGPSETFTHSEYTEIDPSHLDEDWALPVAFHASGQYLIWENSKGDYFTAEYYTSAWGDKSKDLKTPVKGGQISLTPNGSGFFQWQKDIPGINLYMTGNDKADQLLQNKLLLSQPVSTPDGRGVVCLTKDKDQQSLEYILTGYPLSDVVNSWMFAESTEDIDLLARNFGLFRPLSDDQLYQLYESENYYCGSYDQSTPTRPYFITSDIFWELYASAFQGIFTVKERAQAIPAFWSFVNSTSLHYNEKSMNSPWAGVFQVLVSLQKNDLSNPEVKSILDSKGKSYSKVLKRDYDFSQLKPQGIYTMSSEMQLYYRAFRYLNTAFENDEAIVSQLNNLPAGSKELAFDWINSYTEFISKPRRANVFSKEKFIAPKYVQYPDSGLSVFPLSWGFDNEILNSVVYHSAYPKEKQIISTKVQLRLHPSGLDLAAAISSDFAGRLLENEYLEFPNLKPVIESLRRYFSKNSTSPGNTLYDQWINALAEQWIDTLKSTSRDQGDPLWQVKRLQTGLASWATLRHATVLVNENSGAECGEAGFEVILMRAPRGYVEPDPYTLEAIAGLFEKTIEYISPQSKSDIDTRKLYEGIVKNLRETADEIRFFKRIAEKEIKGESLTNEEYEAILYVARIAEHKFLIFKSLANPEYALSNPDPMPKVVNVFGNARTSYLMAAVGKPLEWDFIVPFYGRKQVVKGSVYSYYEFVDDKQIDDSEWLKLLPSQDFLPWIRPYVSKQKLSFPPECGL
jgi:hypothetical protein